MRTLAAIEDCLEQMESHPEPANAWELLMLSEEILEHWLLAHGETPTDETREGFRLLALHRQGATDDPSFNACRESCRELAWHYNLLTLRPQHPNAEHRAQMMALVATHLYLFISGKMENKQLGEFCCASRPIRQASDSVVAAE